MERKNTILLTVIAIATLLVAVVGATFAYFTATFKPQNEEYNTVSAKAAVLPTVTFNYGDKIETSGVDIYPGYKFLKEVTVKGTCTDSGDDCKTVDLVLTLKPNIPAEFGSNIKYAVYKSSTSNSEAVSCDNVKKELTDESSGGVKYYYEGTCTAGSDVTQYNSNNKDFADSIKSGKIEETGYSGTFNTKDNSEDVTILIEDVGGSTDDTYYVVVDYFNNTSDNQNTEQGKEFTITLEANLQP